MDEPKEPSRVFLDSLLDCATADELVHEHVALLSDAEGAVARLVFDRRIPPAVEMRDMRGRRQSEPRSARLERQHEERNALVLLEGPHELFAPADRGVAAERQAGAAEDAGELGA